MRKLKIGTIIETKDGVFVVLKRDSKESYMCIKTQYEDNTKMKFEEILTEDIIGYSGL